MSTELLKELKEVRESLNKSIFDMQQANESKNKELEEAFSKKVEEYAEKHSELATQLDAMQKSAKDLELAMSRRPEGDEGKDFVMSSDEEKSAFIRSLKTRNHGVSSEMHHSLMVKNIKAAMPHLSDEMADLQAKAMLAGSDPDGGVLCPPEYARRIIGRMHETSPMRSIATVVTTTGGSYILPFEAADIEAGWVGEVEERADTTTNKLGAIEIPCHESYAKPTMSLQAIEDATADLNGFMSRKVGDRLARLENTAFVSGNGIGKPKGFLAYDAGSTNFAAGKLETKTTAATSLSADDLIDLQSLLNSGHDGNAVFAMNKKFFSIVAKLKGSDDNYLINPRLLMEGARPMILGKPVVMMDDMPNDETSGGLVVGYGDFREGYTIVDRIGIQSIRDNVTRPGFVKIHFRKRTGGAVSNYEAIKILKMK